MPEYSTIVGSYIILPKGEPIYSEQATTVELADEAAGLFVVVRQDNGSDSGKKISIAPEEWQEISNAVDSLMAMIAEREATKK